MINKLMLAAIATAFVSMPVAAQESAAIPSSPIMSMTMVDGALNGEGADAIIAHIKGAQFILVGEDHGFADSPEIAAALARAARPFGFNHHVIEAGPISVDWVANILRRDGVDGLADGLRGRPLALPFLTPSRRRDTCERVSVKWRNIMGCRPRVCWSAAIDFRNAGGARKGQ